MFEKEAEEYLEKDGTKAEQILNILNEISPLKITLKQLPFILAMIQQTFQDGAEFGYNKANEWHYVKDGDLPKDTTSLYLVRVYSWDFGLSHLYKKYGTYIPTVCEWDGEYFKALDRNAYSNARNINSCVAWKEIVPPQIKEIE